MRVIQGDILKLAVGDMVKANSYLVIANIPYYITSAIIRHLLESKPQAQAGCAYDSKGGGATHLRSDRAI